MFRVIITAECRAELRELKEYIAARESDNIASIYLTRLKTFIQTLALAPYRGEQREGIRFNQRSIGFEGPISVIFEIEEDTRKVNIVGIRYSGRQLKQDS